MPILTHPVNSGLGLLEYLEFIEDVGMEPIMAVWSGEYTIRDGPISHLSLRPVLVFCLRW